MVLGLGLPLDAESSKASPTLPFSLGQRDASSLFNYWAQ